MGLLKGLGELLSGQMSSHSGFEKKKSLGVVDILEEKRLERILLEIKKEDYIVAMRQFTLNEIESAMYRIGESDSDIRTRFISDLCKKSKKIRIAFVPSDSEFGISELTSRLSSLYTAMTGVRNELMSNQQK